jgi:hypothetical protein
MNQALSGADTICQAHYSLFRNKLLFLTTSVFLQLKKKIFGLFTFGLISKYFIYTFMLVFLEKKNSSGYAFFVLTSDFSKMNISACLTFVFFSSNSF